MPTIIGIFQEKGRAEKALQELKNNGFSEREISLVAKNGEEKEQTQTGTTMQRQDISDGTITGGALGGLAGLLVGTGALLIPGVGPIIAAGPLAATLTGLVGGGIAGGLIDLGIPEERGQYFEERVKQGGILLSVKAEKEEQANIASQILRNFGAEDVESH